MPKYSSYVIWKGDVFIADDAFNVFSKVHITLAQDHLRVSGPFLEHLGKTVWNITFINVLGDFESLYRHLKIRVVYPKGRTDVLTCFQMSTVN